MSEIASKIQLIGENAALILKIVLLVLGSMDKELRSFPTMTLTRGYILVLDPERRHRDDAHPLEADLQYPVFVASSTEQAVSRVNQEAPCLVILVGNNFQAWSQPLVNQLRQHDQAPDMTIVALTDSASPQWDYREDTPGLDGLLVKPLSMDILRSLVESAFARRVDH